MVIIRRPLHEWVKKRTYHDRVRLNQANEPRKRADFWRGMNNSGVQCTIDKPWTEHGLQNTVTQQCWFRCTTTLIDIELKAENRS